MNYFCTILRGDRKQKKDIVMNKLTTVLLGLSLGTAGLVGCTNTAVDTTAGAAAGAGLGYAVSGGSTLGTLVGTGAGAVVGNSIGQYQDNQYYNRSNYYRDGFYY